MSADHRRGIFAATHLIYPSVRVEIREPRCHSEQEIRKFWSLLCIGVLWSPWSSTPNRVTEQLFNPCKQTLFCLLQKEKNNLFCCRQTDIFFVGELLNFFWWVGGGSRSAAHDRGHFGRNLGVDKTKAKQVPMCTPTRFSLCLLMFSLLFVKKGMFYLGIQRCKNELEEWGWGCQNCGSPDGDQKVFVAKDQKVMALADMVA